MKNKNYSLKKWYTFTAKITNSWAKNKNYCQSNWIKGFPYKWIAQLKETQANNAVIEEL